MNKMKYENEKLNITIENREYVDIIEFDNYVELRNNGVLKFILFNNSSAVLFNNSSAKLYHNSSAKLYHNSSAELCDNSSAVLYHNSSAKLYDNSSAVLFDNSSAKLYDNSSAELYDNSSAELCDNSSAKLYDNSSAELCDNSSAVLFNNSSAKLYHNSSAKLYHNSSAVLFDNSSAKLYDNSSAELCDFTVVWVKSNNIKIETFNHFGSIIKQVFKVKEKMLVYKKLANKLIATLELEKGQIFQSQYHSKCRTDRAKVIVIENIDKTEKFDIGYSQNDNKFVYKVGETVSADYDEEIKECSSGIHFFLSRKSAEEY